MGANYDQKRRAFWLKEMHQWHWISSAVCLIIILLFTITGITLNHAGEIGAQPKVTTKKAALPKHLATELSSMPSQGKAPVPPAIAKWVWAQLSVSTEDVPTEWSEDEIYVSLPRPGGDAWLTIDRATGEVHYERTDRGWISYMNDLHKGRNTGAVWRWFIDVFAVSCLVFCITGLFLLQLHAGNRPATWPIVGLGLVVPLLLAILFIHG